MLTEKFIVNKFGEFLPQMENILRCGLFTYSFRTQETSWSAGIFEIIGLEPFSIENDFRSFASFILPEDRARVFENVNRAREKHQTYNLDFSILDAKGIYKRIHAETAIK